MIFALILHVSVYIVYVESYAENRYLRVGAYLCWYLVQVRGRPPAHAFSVLLLLLLLTLQQARFKCPMSKGTS